MALVIPTLQAQIVNALKKAQQAPSTAAGNQILATELAKAIDLYIKSGDVITTVTTVVAAPIPVAGMAGTLPVVAATVSPGAGTGAGIGKVT